MATYYQATVVLQDGKKVFYHEFTALRSYIDYWLRDLPLKYALVYELPSRKAKEGSIYGVVTVKHGFELISDYKRRKSAYLLSVGKAPASPEHEKPLFAQKKITMLQKGQKFRFPKGARIYAYSHMQGFAAFYYDLGSGQMYQVDGDREVVPVK